MQRVAGVFALVVVLAWNAERPAHAQEATAFGQPGQLVFDASLQGAFNYQKVSNDVDEASTTTIIFSPSLIYMAAPNFGIGGGLTFVNQDAENTSQTSFAVGPVAGFNLELGPRISLFPRVSIAYANNTVKVGDGELSSSGIVFGAAAPLLIHPVPHLFFGVGPGFSYTLTSNYEIGGMGLDDDPKTLTFNVLFMIGGWL
jgi:hypothetical protein